MSPYLPDFESLKEHRAPDWFSNAKLGIFIHWGLYSVPGWAPIPHDWIEKVNTIGWDAALASYDQRYAMANNVYAEWYLNSLRFPDSPTRDFHNRTYGSHFSYDDFAPIFNREIRKWDPDEWSELFARIGARYLVLVTKHHDGFLLWNSATPCPVKTNYMAGRNIVSELTQSVRKQGMKMGFYYSGGLDWAFNPKVIESYAGIYGSVIQDAGFIRYVDAHWRELIERFAPEVLWNDIGYPMKANLPGLCADYYNRVPNGVINDRFRQAVKDGRSYALHYDYLTPEYSSFGQIMQEKWETCRGVGYSFGYNVNDNEQTYLSTENLVHTFVDIVSKNGNMLLNVGPKADGSIPAEQRERLEGLGDWLRVNGEAIFDTHPWERAESTTGDGIPVRFTQKNGNVFAILLGKPMGEQVAIQGLQGSRGMQVDLLGIRQNLEWREEGISLVVRLPAGLPASPAIVLRLTNYTGMN
jgi:alpha-L-fucosidase